MSRFYSVTFENPELPLSFTAVSIPDTDATALEELGIDVKLTFTPYGSIDATGILRDLVVFDALQERRESPAIELSSNGNPGAFHDFLSFVAREAFIPVEGSSLGGATLEGMMRQASLLGFGAFAAGAGLLHHDPIVYIVAPPTTIVVGAGVGVAEGSRMRAQHVLSPPPKAPRARKSRR